MSEKNLEQPTTQEKKSMEQKEYSKHDVVSFFNEDYFMVESIIENQAQDEEAVFWKEDLSSISEALASLLEGGNSSAAKKLLDTYITNIQYSIKHHISPDPAIATLVCQKREEYLKKLKALRRTLK